MAHGLRRWVGRAAQTGLGLVLCTGLAGCLGNDKKPPVKQIGPPPGATGRVGQPGTPAYPGGTAAGLQPGAGMGSGVQPAGGMYPTQPGQPGSITPPARPMNPYNTPGAGSYPPGT